MARLRAGLTQVQLAARVGCHPMTIGTAERGALSRQLAQRCAEVLGVGVEELLDEARRIHRRPTTGQADGARRHEGGAE